MEKKKAFNVSEKRWIIRELESGRLSMSEACELMSDASKDPRSMIHYWQKKYSPGIAVTLPVMTEKERQKLEAAQKRMKALEKQLEDAQMKNIALETMIDIAEEELRISIRKKSGPGR
jgi:tRNA 2-selenouridine synthase SelU